MEHVDEVPLTDPAMQGIYEVGVKVSAWNGSTNSALARLERELAQGLKALGDRLETAVSQISDWQGQVRVQAEAQSPSLDAPLDDDRCQATQALAVAAAKLRRQLQSSPHGQQCSANEAICQEMEDALNSLGLEPIPVEHVDFNPALHQCVERREMPAENEGRIVGLVRRGYFNRQTGRAVTKALVAVGCLAGNDGRDIDG